MQTLAPAGVEVGVAGVDLGVAEKVDWAVAERVDWAVEAATK